MAEMSDGLANCFCGQPRLKPPLNPSAGQAADFAGAAPCCAKSTGSVNNIAVNAAPIPNAASFIVIYSPGGQARSLRRPCRPPSALARVPLRPQAKVGPPAPLDSSAAMLL